MKLYILFMINLKILMLKQIEHELSHLKYFLHKTNQRLDICFEMSMFYTLSYKYNFDGGVSVFNL